MEPVSTESSNESVHLSPAFKRWMAVLWPAFLGAGVLCGIVFSLVDPEELSWFGRPLELSRLAIYTMGFFAFWMVQAASAYLACVLLESNAEK